MIRHGVYTLAALSMVSLLWSAPVANGQEVRGRPLPEPAYRGGNVARVPGAINGMNGSAGTSSTYTGVGVPTGGSAINQNSRTSPSVRIDRMTR